MQNAEPLRAQLHISSLTADAGSPEQRVAITDEDEGVLEDACLCVDDPQRNSLLFRPPDAAV